VATLVAVQLLKGPTVRDSNPGRGNILSSSKHLYWQELIQSHIEWVPGFFVISEVARV